jgi:hypothetical protein
LIFRRDLDNYLFVRRRIAHGLKGLDTDFKGFVTVIGGYSEMVRAADEPQRGILLVVKATKK